MDLSQWEKQTAQKRRTIFAWIYLAVFLLLFIMALLRTFGVTSGEPVGLFAWLLIITGLVGTIYYFITRQKPNKQQS